MADEWRVYAVRPRPSGKEGRNWTMVAEPPAGLRVRRIRKSTKKPTEAEAWEAARRWQAGLNSGVLSGHDPLAVDVLAKHVAWRETAGEGALDTLVAYQQSLRRLRPLLGETRASKLTRAELLRVRDAVRATPLGAGSTQQTMNCLAGAWRWALEREWVSVDLPKIARLKVPETDKRPLEPHELEAMLEWVAGYQGGYWLPLVVLLVDAGTRISETLALKGRDVDLGSGSIRLRGKGGKVRVVDGIPPETLALLPVRDDPDEYVFQARRRAHRKGKPLNRRTPLGVLWRAAEAVVADPDRVDLHSIRRTWISEAHEAGVPMLASMRVTGHASTAVHLGYARRARLAARSAVEAVRARRGPRSWEGTAETPQEPQRVAAPNSSPFPPESLARESCWSAAGVAQPKSQLLLDLLDHAQEQAPNLSEQAGVVLSPFCGAHPLGGRIEALVGFDAEAALALVLDPAARAGVEEWARRRGLLPAQGQPRQCQSL